MYLIEYSDGCFIGANKIDWLKVSKGEIKFSIGNADGLYTVQDELADTFINHLQGLQCNIVNMESKWHSLKEEV